MILSIFVMIHLVKEIIQRAIASANGQARKIINTAGNLYREMGLKDKLDTMNQSNY